MGVPPCVQVFMLEFRMTETENDSIRSPQTVGGSGRAGGMICSERQGVFRTIFHADRVLSISELFGRVLWWVFVRQGFWAAFVRGGPP